MRILLVSQMYPGPGDPDLGVFVAQIERALVERGHEIERAVLDSRAGGKARYATLARRVRAAAQSFRPDVAYAHFLVPAGLAATLASDAPLVVTAHGQDVRNIGTVPGIRLATQRVVRRAQTVVCVSDYLRRELEAKVPEARRKCVVVDSGVDLERFRSQPAPPGPIAYLCIGGLTDRKNVLRLADAFQRLPQNGATLTFLGDGPLRSRLEGRPGVNLAAAVTHDEVPEWIGRAHVVCQPSLIEPFGQAILEAMACGRPVVATRVGGPPEFVPPEAGVLVDPTDLTDLADGLRLAAAFSVPNQAATAAAAAHDVRLQAERIEAILEQAERVS